MSDKTYMPKTYRDLGGDRFNIAPGGILNIEGRVIGLMPTTDYFVDTTNGSDSNDGLSWVNAFATISAAMTLAAALGTRGRARIFVAPGGYTEDIVTPLNTECPFGQLIAVNPTGRSAGAVWLFSATATEPCITVRARGWLIDGFEFDANSGVGGGCILLDGVTSNANAKFLNVRNCLFVGGAQVNDYGIKANESSPLVVIEDCMFYQFGGKAIDATAYPLKWEIARCWFEDNQNHIAPSSSKGMQACWIHDCTFAQIGALYTVTIKIDNRGGSTNLIGPNNFLGGTYDNSGGYYAAGNDTWRGNHTEVSEGGSAQVNPTA